jgi:5-methylcytosine-specific restriction endonuclease McrA
MPTRTRVCAQVGCPNLTINTYCPRCAKSKTGNRANARVLGDRGGAGVIRDKAADARFRTAVVKRGFCQRCGRTAREVKLTAHHHIPLSAGGVNHPVNGIALCTDCHRAVDPYYR